MDIYIDIETLRSPQEHKMMIIDEVKSDFKAPYSLSKTQAAEDLGLDPKSDEVKYTSKDDMISRWETELAEEKSADVAHEKWEKTSFNPDVAPIACICIHANGINLTFNLNTCRDEKELLDLFHRSVEELCRGTLPNFIGHNIGKFDLPFIWKRSVINDVKCCSGVKWQDGRHGQHFYDTMIAWAGFGKTISADNLSKILGFDGKSDMDGSKVYDTWQVDPEKVIQYCHDDVAMVKAIHERLIK